MIPFFKRTYDRASQDRISQVINSGFLTTGQIGQNVENQLKDFFSVNDAALCNSWTSCWELVLSYHNIGPGDEVVMPSMTFVSCANAVVRRGAKVVFCDICPHELVVNVEKLSKHISDKTKIILVVHLYGLMADMAEIIDVYRDIAIYEDSAHCFEGSRSGIRPGTISDGAIFSFYATKNISCGEGGALISNDKKLVEFVKIHRLHGMSKTAIDRYTSRNYSHWDVRTPGQKFNLPDILAALLPEQIEKCLSERDLRNNIYHFYLKHLKESGVMSYIRIQYIPEEVEHSHHLFAIGVNKHLRDDLLKFMGQNDIGVAVNFRDLPSLTYYNNHNRPLEAEEWGSSTISLPFYPEIPNDNILQVVKILKSFFEREHK